MFILEATLSHVVDCYCAVTSFTEQVLGEGSAVKADCVMRVDTSYKQHLKMKLIKAEKF